MTPKVPLIAAACSLVLIGLFAAPALGRDGGSNQEFRLRDKCDPATFNANGRVLCTPGVTEPEVTLPRLQAFLAAQPPQILSDRDALGWKIDPDHTEVARGATRLIRSRAGETHTFSDVTSTGFTGGCVAGLNAPFGLQPNSQCASNPNIVAATSVLAGKSTTIALTRTGTALFQCLIHPWMRTTISVR